MGRRDYSPWEMEPEIRESLDTAMRDGTYPGLGEIRTREGIQRLEAQHGRQALTAQLAGTVDKSSRAWKNARDNLSRWRSGRRSISAGSASKVATGVKNLLGSRYRDSGSLNVELYVTVTTSRTSWTGKMAADLTGADLEDYLSACEQGQWEQAAMIVADAYGLDPEYILSIDDVHGFDASTPDDEE
jgi:soluble lytic murein transglycosylase-like protein